MFVAVQVPILLFIGNTSAVNNPYYDVDEDKVAICHATKSTTNPYSNLNNPGPQIVNKSSIVKVTGSPGDEDVEYGGHGEHTGPVFPLKDEDGNWGDIIPPFEYKKNRNSMLVVYPGLNWTTAGQAIWANDCQAPLVNVTAVPTMNQITCEAAGSYTLPTITGVAYTVNGDAKAAGTYQVALSTTINISIEATTGYNFTGQKNYTFNFTAPTDCEEDTVLGSITIIKDAQPNNIQDFVFSATGLTGVTSFTLDDDGDETNTYKNSISYDDLEADEYTFTEQTTTGWTLASINCTKEDATTVVTVAVPKVTINLAEGDDVSCTFVNTLNAVVEEEEPGEVLGDNDEVVAVGGQGGAVLGEQGAVLGAQTVAPVGGVAAGYGAAASTSLSSLAGLGASLSALGYGVASLRKRQ